MLRSYYNKMNLDVVVVLVQGDYTNGFTYIPFVGH